MLNMEKDTNLWTGEAKYWLTNYTIKEKTNKEKKL